MAKRVFFSFHYQDVKDFRANVVRQSWVTQDREEAGYFDASLWEESKKKGDADLKRLINDGLNGTSVTAVLIGSDTYSRRWVRYEIIKSLATGNKVLGVHINSIKCKNGQTKAHGNNPFNYIGAQYSALGDRIDFWEWNGNAWIQYNEVAGYALKMPDTKNAGKFKKFSDWYTTRCWVADDGYTNFADWVGN